MRKRIGLIALVLALIMLTGCAEHEMPTEAPELKEPVAEIRVEPCLRLRKISSVISSAWAVMTVNLTAVLVPRRM